MKEGIKSTEFWGKSIIQLGSMIGFYFGLPISLETLTVLVGGMEAVYTAGRSLVKAFS